MARQISIREQYPRQCDEATLQAVLKVLGKEFLLIPLGNDCIEVAEQDYAAVSLAISEFMHDAEHSRNS